MLASGAVPVLLQFARTGVPLGLRGQLWLAALQIAPTERDYLDFARLQREVPPYYTPLLHPLLHPLTTPPTTPLTTPHHTTSLHPSLHHLTPLLRRTRYSVCSYRRT